MAGLLGKILILSVMSILLLYVYLAHFFVPFMNWIFLLIPIPK